MEPNEIKDWLEARRMSVRDLSMRLGVSAALVYAWMQGTRRVPRWLQLALRAIEQEPRNGKDS
jgi:DNA-binding transcriptional regulator YiaG